MIQKEKLPSTETIAGLKEKAQLMYFITSRKNKIPCVTMHYILDTVVSASIPRG